MNLAFGAKEVPVEFHPSAARTFTLAGLVHDYAFVALDVEQGLSRGFALFISLLQFEGIKPNPAATALTGVQDDVADWQLR